MRQKTCSACGGKMQSLGNMELQKGRFSMLFGNLSQITSGALDVDVECCERCKKLEFYLLGDPEEPETSGSFSSWNFFRMFSRTASGFSRKNLISIIGFFSSCHSPPSVWYSSSAVGPR